MDNSNQQTVVAPSADDTSAPVAAVPAVPVTGADIAEQAKDIAEHDLSTMMPAMPETQPEEPVAEATPQADFSEPTPPAPEANAWDAPATPAPTDTPVAMPPAAEPEQPAAPAAPVDTPPAA